MLLIQAVRPSEVSCIRYGKRQPELPHHTYPYQMIFHCVPHGAPGTGMEIRDSHVYILPETAGGRQPVPAGVTVEKSRKPFVFCLFSGFRDTDVPERCP